MIKIRINLDNGTIEVQGFDTPEAAQRFSTNCMITGAWANNTLFPPHRIVSIEILEEKLIETV